MLTSLIRAAQLWQRNRTCLQLYKGQLIQGRPAPASRASWIRLIKHVLQWAYAQTINLLWAKSWTVEQNRAEQSTAAMRIVPAGNVSQFGGMYMIVSTSSRQDRSIAYAMRCTEIIDIIVALVHRICLSRHVIMKGALLSLARQVSNSGRLHAMALSGTITNSLLPAPHEHLSWLKQLRAQQVIQCLMRSHMLNGDLRGHSPQKRASA